ncbi:hypothetical protein [Streptomyces sp. NPDC087300]|uniref:hypothetical protein n=1 Tax=Streptomyces sp. NPDC087300 TaxID=3365780 RepID=UPI0038285A35
MMIRKVLAGAALATAATAATVSAAGVASATTGSGPEAENMTSSAHDMNKAARVAYGETVSGTGNGSSEFATNNGDVAIAGDTGGVANAYGAPFVDVDLRCAVPAAQGVGGNVLGGPVTTCNNAPVDQFDAPERII